MVNILIPIFNLGGGCLLLVILRMAGVVGCILLLLGKGVIVNQHSSQSILLSFFHSYCRSLQTPLTLNKISTFYPCFIPSPLSSVIKTNDIDAVYFYMSTHSKCELTASIETRHTNDTPNLLDLFYQLRPQIKLRTRQAVCSWTTLSIVPVIHL